MQTDILSCRWSNLYWWPQELNLITLKKKGKEEIPKDENLTQLDINYKEMLLVASRNSLACQLDFQNHCRHFLYSFFVWTRRKFVANKINASSNVTSVPKPFGTFPTYFKPAYLCKESLLMIIIALYVNRLLWNALTSQTHVAAGLPVRYGANECVRSSSFRETKRENWI